MWHFFPSSSSRDKNKRPSMPLMKFLRRLSLCFLIKGQDWHFRRKNRTNMMTEGNVSERLVWYAPPLPPQAQNCQRFLLFLCALVIPPKRYAKIAYKVQSKRRSILFFASPVCLDLSCSCAPERECFFLDYKCGLICESGRWQSGEGDLKFSREFRRILRTERTKEENRRTILIDVSVHLCVSRRAYKPTPTKEAERKWIYIL